MSDVWVVRNRGGDIVQITDYEPWEQPDGWTTARETLLTPEMAAVIAAAKALRDVPFSGSPIDAAAWTVAFDNLDIAVAALRAVEEDA
jgi:hypothetical protein